jgi:hypothetical protein
MHFSVSALPIPLAAPVITATLPAKSCMEFFLRVKQRV